MKFLKPVLINLYKIKSRRDFNDIINFRLADFGNFIMDNY